MGLGPEHPLLGSVVLGSLWTRHWEQAVVNTGSGAQGGGQQGSLLGGIHEVWRLQQWHGWQEQQDYETGKSSGIKFYSGTNHLLLNWIALIWKYTFKLYEVLFKSDIMLSYTLFSSLKLSLSPSHACPITLIILIKRSDICLLNYFVRGAVPGGTSIRMKV